MNYNKQFSKKETKNMKSMTIEITKKAVIAE